MAAQPKQEKSSGSGCSTYGFLGILFLAIFAGIIIFFSSESPVQQSRPHLIVTPVVVDKKVIAANVAEQSQEENPAIIRIDREGDPSQLQPVIQATIETWKEANPDREIVDIDYIWRFAPDILYSRTQAISLFWRPKATPTSYR